MQVMGQAVTKTAIKKLGLGRNPSPFLIRTL